MSKRIGGSRRKSRHKFRKNVRDHGKISIKNYIQKFSIGDKVYLKAEPAVQKAIYHVRFHGKAGVILNKRGRCYEVLIKDFNSDKKLILHPVHMEKR